VPLQQFFRAYKQIDKKKEEYIEKIMFAIPTGKYLVNFEKVSKRRNLDIAAVNTAIKIEFDGVIISTASLAAGGVAPIPAFLKNASLLLKGKIPDEDLVEEVVDIARKEVKPITDARGTAAYKKQLLGQLIKAHFIQLFPALDVKQLIGKA
jgi:xanthine dehydrogenase small subunit